jgi:hypothetical protein
MNIRILIGLFLALVVAAGASFLLINQQSTVESKNEDLLGDFSQELVNLNELTIYSGGQSILNAKLQQGSWQASHLAQDSLFPVDKEQIRKLINGLQSAILLEAKTKNPANYERLGVEDYDSQGAKSALLVLSSKDATYELLIGNQSRSGAGTFVRVKDDPQSWLIDQVIDLPKDQYTWLQSPVLDIPIALIEKVEFVGEQNWVANKTSEDQGQVLTMLGLTESETLKYPSIVDNTIEGYFQARFESVEPQNEILLPDSPTAQVFIELAEGPMTLNLYQANDNYWLTYVVPSRPWLGDWVFGLDSFNFNKLNKNRSDFVDLVEESTLAPIEGLSPVS